MAWWNRRPRRTPASLQLAQGVVAAVQRYDLSNETDRKALAKSQQEWQSSAWYYADAVGELKDACRFVENSFRRVRLYASFMRDPEAQPIPVAEAVRPADGGPEQGIDADPRDDDDYLDPRWAMEAEAIVAGFAARDGGQALLLGKLGVNIFLVGEAIIINREVPTRRATREELAAGLTPPTVLDWEVRSVDEVREARGGGGGTNDPRMELVSSPDQQTGEPLPNDSYVERIWRQHARWSAWADSNVRAAIGTLEELDLLAKLARSSIRSRLLAGLVLIPDELDFGAADQPAGGGSGAKTSVRFDRQIDDALRSVINNEADANGASPIGMRGKAEALKEVRVVEFPRRYNEEDRAQYEAAVKKLGRTIELPVERTEGMADLNHWTAWQIDEDTYEAYVEPLAGVAAEGLTFGLLRPMMLELGCPEEVVERLTVSVDPSQLVRRPDRGKVATEGYNLFALSGEAWRRANAFGDDDAPTAEELQRRLIFARGTIGQELTAAALEALGMLPEGAADAVAEAAKQRRAEAFGGGQQDDAGGDSGDDAGGGDGGGEPPAEEDAPQAQAAAAVTAAARRTASAEGLALADRVLSEKLLVAADAAMSRAVERAGARLRTRAQRNAEARTVYSAATSSRDVRNIDMAVVLGPAITAALATDEELFGDAFSELRTQYEAWVSGTQAFALDTLESIGGELSAEQREELERRMEEDREDGWSWLLAALLGAASNLLARGGAAEAVEEGEFDATVLVQPTLIREALARAGGTIPERTRAGGVETGDGPVGGPATGRTVRVSFAEAGFPWSGFRWDYTAAVRTTPFAPHQALGGETFESWDSDVLAAGGGWPYVSHYFPGDHAWCKCSFTPMIAEAAAASVASAAITEE